MLFKRLEDKIIECKSEEFEQLTLDVFRYQASNNPVYSKYLGALDIHPDSINSLDVIPFLPIRFWKTQTIKTGNWQEECIFESSGTTGVQASKQFIYDTTWYQKNAILCFEHVLGNLHQYTHFALLPGYLERPNSSLVFMLHTFAKHTHQIEHCFYLDDYKTLYEQMISLQADKNIILWGVSFALLDFIKQFDCSKLNIIVIETGGMKNKQESFTAKQIISALQAAFINTKVYSEYGMTELNSQAYRKSNYYTCPPTMQIQIGDLLDPFANVQNGNRGRIKIIDLANVHTCSFVETEDAGIIHQDGTFEILGRIDGAELRGCNLLIDN